MTYVNYVECNKKVGFQQAVSLYAETTQALSDINKSSAIIFNPKSSIEDRVNAYNRIANVQQQFANRAGLERASVFFAGVQTSLDAYLKTVPVGVPQIGSGPDYLPIKIDKHDATLLDFINAINNKDATENFTVDAHFNDQFHSIRNVAWADHDFVQDRLVRENSGKCGSGVSVSVSKDSGCNKDYSMHASGSVTTWEKYAVGQQNTDPSSAQAKALAEFTKIMTFKD